MHRPDSKGIQSIFQRRNLFSQEIFPRFFWGGVFFAVLVIFGSGCSDLELTRAFDGDFLPQKNNKVIGEYCTSCHIHKEFDAGQHLAKIRSDYRRRFFRTARECRACHYLENQWAYNSVLRKTRRPQDANRGVFRNFEKQQMKHLGKS